jgi:hypothetical protein
MLLKHRHELNEDLLGVGADGHRLPCVAFFTDRIAADPFVFPRANVTLIYYNEVETIPLSRVS